MGGRRLELGWIVGPSMGSLNRVVARVGRAGTKQEHPGCAGG